MFCGYMVQANNDSRRIGGVNPGRGLDDACSTITQTGSHQQLVTAFVARDFGTSTGHAMDVPAATVMPEGQGKSRLIVLICNPITVPTIHVAKTVNRLR